MPKKIYLSPSSQPENSYAYGNTNEAVQCRRIATACQKALERCGFSVKNGLDGTMYTRTADSNKWDADLHIPIHTNAANRSVTGTRIMSYDTKGEGYKAAKAVFNALAPITLGKSENITAHPELYEIKATNAPCVYIECEFHDVESVAKWIIEHVDDIGEAIAKGVCNYYGVIYKTEAVEEETETESKPEPEPKPEPDSSFLVRVEINNLNIRTGPGVNYNRTGSFTGKGVFTIVETKPGTGSNAGWGRLKSGAGWISLDFAKRYKE